MTREMQEKIQMIDEYITKAKEIEASKNIDDADRYAKHVLGIYSAEIPGLKDSLSRFEWKFGDERTDYLFDVSLLRAKLQNHKNNLQSGLYSKFFSGSGGNVTISQNTQQSMENSISISLEQTLENINSLPEESLNTEEKVELAQKLATIFASKDKTSKWDIAKGILKWLGDKGVEVGIAALPYIVQSLQ